MPDSSHTWKCDTEKVRVGVTTDSAYIFRQESGRISGYMVEGEGEEWMRRKRDISPVTTVTSSCPLPAAGAYLLCQNWFLISGIIQLIIHVWTPEKNKDWGGHVILEPAWLSTVHHEVTVGAEAYLGFNWEWTPRTGSQLGSESYLRAIYSLQPRWRLWDNPHWHTAEPRTSLK